MSHSMSVPPVHETSPPPFDDDIDDNDFIPTINQPNSVESESLNLSNNNNDDDETPIAQIIVESAHCSNPTDCIEPDLSPVDNTTPVKTRADSDGWANFASFEPSVDDKHIEVRKYVLHVVTIESTVVVLLTVVDCYHYLSCIALLGLGQLNKKRNKHVHIERIFNSIDNYVRKYLNSRESHSEMRPSSNEKHLFDSDMFNVRSLTYVELQ
jgi:hypothetical protein